jgi:hypothetical protein
MSENASELSRRGINFLPRQKFDGESQNHLVHLKNLWKLLENDLRILKPIIIVEEERV